MAALTPEHQGINIEVVYALPDKQQLITMAVPSGTLAREAAVQAIRTHLITLAETDAVLDPNTIPLGVYGQIVADDYPMQAGDRLELYRPLQQDPKERRRQLADEKSSRNATRKTS